MPEEVLAIVIISIFCGSIITIVKSVLSYRERTRYGVAREQVTRTSAAEGKTLTTSELQRMMREAVEEATAPLQERIDDLEAMVPTTRPGARAATLDDPGEPRQADPVRKSVGGQIR